MANEKINKVVLGSETLIDLTGDTVTASDVLYGKTFHDKSGETVTGACTYDSNTTDADATASEILAGKFAYVNKNKIEGQMVNRGGVNITIDDLNGESIPVGYHDGSGTVDIDSTEKAKIVDTNIKAGIQILGVTGTYSGEAVSAQSKTVTSSLTQQTVLPDTPTYDYLSQVTVDPIPVSRVLDQTTNGIIVTIGGN